MYMIDKNRRLLSQVYDIFTEYECQYYRNIPFKASIDSSLEQINMPASYEFSNGCWCILLNPRLYCLDMKELEFVVLHEIAHILKQHKIHRTLEQEIEADRWAACRQLMKYGTQYGTNSLCRLFSLFKYDVTYFNENKRLEKLKAITWNECYKNA